LHEPPLKVRIPKKIYLEREKRKRKVYKKKWVGMRRAKGIVEKLAECCKWGGKGYSLTPLPPTSNIFKGGDVGAAELWFVSVYMGTLQWKAKRARRRKDPISHLKSIDHRVVPPMLEPHPIAKEELSVIEYREGMGNGDSTGIKSIRPTWVVN